MNSVVQPAPMRVLFDAFELAPGTGKSMGIYNYARHLLPALTEVAGPSIQFVVACNSACAADFRLAAPTVSTRILHHGVPGKFARQVWWRGRAALEAAKARAEIYFSPKGFLPYAMGLLAPRVRTVVVVHDLIPLWYRAHHPGHFGLLEEHVVARALIDSVRGAHGLIAISQATADDIKTRVGRREGVCVVPNGIPTTPPGEPPLPGPYIMAVTSRLPHKNATGVLQAYQRYRERTPHPLPMVVCGLDASSVAGVHCVSRLTDAQLHGCYAHASLLLFLPRIEGFGFPPVEAMAHGTPVICSDIPALREVTRGAATLVPLDDPDRTASAMTAVLAGSHPDAAEITGAVADFTWQKCAAGIIDVFTRLHAGAPGC